MRRSNAEDSSEDEYDPAEVVVKVLHPPSPGSSDAMVSTLTSLRSVATVHSPAVVDPLAKPASKTGQPGSSTSSYTPDTPATDGGGYRLHSDIKGRVRCLAVNPAGTILCAGSEDGKLCMWDFSAPLESHRVQPTRMLTPFVNRISGLQPIIALTSAKDGSYFVACQDGDSPALVRASGAQLGYCAMGERGLMDVVQCKGHRAPVTCVAAHAQDAAGFFTGSQDGTVRLWNSNTYKQHSIFAIKHGSGQLTDTHVVESVASLDEFHNGQGRIFASGGQDGRVQVWDSRVKYRPGGAVATIDMFTSPTTAGLQRLTEDPFLEKHVGDLLEVRPSETEASPSGAGGSGLAVRIGSTVKLLDLRRLSSGVTAASASVVTEVATSLPATLDTSSLSLGSGGASSTLLTCTSRQGYNHVAGGHVVEFSFTEAQKFSPSMVWRAGKQDEDVLCVCADPSRGDGCVYAGLSSGEVVVRDAFSGGGAPQPLEVWLQTRPEKENYSRAVGKKAPRPIDEDRLMQDLF